MVICTETGVDVLAAVLGAGDRGYRVLVPADAICSSLDEGHDTSLALFHQRFSIQVKAVNTIKELLRNWR